MRKLIDSVLAKSFGEIASRPKIKIEDKDLKIVIDDIYLKINAIEKRLTNLRPPAQNFEGNAGDVRVVKDKTDDKVYIEAKSDEGWAKTELTLKD